MVRTSLKVLFAAAVLFPVSASAQLECDLESGDAARWRVGMVNSVDFVNRKVSIQGQGSLSVQDDDSEILNEAAEAGNKDLDFLYCVNTTGGPLKIQRAAAAKP